MRWPKGDLVEVEWVDSASTNGWQHDLPPDDGLMTCRSAGYLISKDRVSVKIVQSQATNGPQAELIAIPRSCVRVIRKLSRGKA